MAVDPTRALIIRATLTQEVLHAAGLPRQWWGKRLLDTLLWPITRRFALKMARFDQDITDIGIAAAARRLLVDFVDQVWVCGRGHIPASGPVLLACNHPGAYDSFAIAASLTRPDLQVIASGVDFTRSMPGLASHLIYVTPDSRDRMTAVRQGVRHLENGGILFIFSTGLVDPDPSLWPERAARALEDWSGSLEIFLRRVPETQFVTGIASHVLSAACACHPLTRLARQDWQRRRLAEYLQVFQQLAFGRRFGLAPRLSFSPPLADSSLPREDLRGCIQSRARQAMVEHIDRPLSGYAELLSKEDR